MRYALITAVLSLSALAQPVRPGAPSGLVMMTGPTVRTCQIPSNDKGIPGEGTVTIDLVRKTVSRDGRTQDCFRASFTSEMVKEILREQQLGNDLSIQRKQITQEEANLDLHHLKTELALLEGTLLIKCVDQEQHEERNYFVSLSIKPSHYGYSGLTLKRDLYDGLVSEMTCR